MDDISADLERLRALAARPLPVKQNEGFLSDLGTDLKIGANRLPSAATGLVDIPLGLAFDDNIASKAADFVGDKIPALDFDGRAARAQQEFSPARQVANQQLADAKGFSESAKHLLANPAQVAGLATQAVLGLVAGGVAARGVLAAAKGINPAVAVGLGEGSVSGGLATDELNKKDISARTAALGGAATLASTAGIGAVGAWVSRKIGVVDVDAALAGVNTASDIAEASGNTLAQRMLIRAKTGASLGLRGAVAEGVLEEAPQSAAETAISNIAEGNDVSEGVGKAVATGGLVGGALGGGINFARGVNAPVSTPVDDSPKTTQEALEESVVAQADTPAEQEATEPEQAKEAAVATPEAKGQTVEELSAISGVGTKPTKKGPSTAQALADATTKEDVEAVLADRKTSPSARDQVRTSAFYTGLPGQSTETTASRVRQTTIETHQQSLNTQAQKVRQRQDNPVGTVPADVLEDTLTEVIGAEATQTEDGPQKPEIDEQGKAGLYTAISGVTNETSDKLIADRRTQLQKQITKSRKQLVSSLSRGKGAPRLLTTKGVPIRKLKDKQLGVFVQGLNAISADTVLHGNRRNAILDRARELDAQYKTDVFLPAASAVTASAAQAVAARPTQEIAASLERVVTALQDSPDGASVAELEGPLNEMNALTAEYDALSRIIGSDAELARTTGGEFRVNREDTTIDADADAVADQIKLQARKDKGSLLSAKEQARVDSFDTVSTHEQAAATAVIQGTPLTEGETQLGEGLSAVFAALENKFGRNNVKAAMALGKSQVEDKAGQAAPLNKIGSETSAAVRFNVLYSVYREQGGVLPFISYANKRRTIEADRKLLKGNDPEASVLVTGAGLIASPEGQIDTRMTELMRGTFTRAQKAAAVSRAKTNNPDSYDSASATQKARMEEVARNALIEEQKVAPLPPVQALLEHIIHTDISPQARTLANALKRILNQGDARSLKQKAISVAASSDEEVSGLGTYLNSLEVEVFNAAAGPNNQLGSFVSPEANEGVPKIQLWQRGTNTGTVLHEIVHAVTAGMAFTYDNLTTAQRDKINAGGRGSLSKNQLALMDDLTVLRDSLTQAVTGEEVPEKIRNIFTKISQPRAGIAEFLALALTKTDLQVWMKTHKVPKDASEQLKGRTWWRVFATKIKSLLGRVAGSTKDSYLDSFIDASSGVLGEVFVASADKDNRVFGEKGRRRRKQASLQDTADPAAPKDFAADSTTATKAAIARQRSEDKTKRSQKQGEEEAKKDDQDRRAARAIAQAKAAGRNTDPTLSRTVVAPQSNSRDLTLIDSIERTVFNGVMEYAVPGKYHDWEEGAQALLDYLGEQVVNFTKKDTLRSRVVGGMLASVVDRFGVPETMKGGLDAIAVGQQLQASDAAVSFQQLQGLNVAQAQVLLDRLDGKDEKSLAKALPDEQQRAVAIQLADSLEALLETARARGIEVRQINGRDATVAQLIDLTVSAEAGQYVGKTMDTVAPVNREKNIVRTNAIPAENVLGEDGVVVERGEAGSKDFYRAAHPLTGEEYFIEVGADTAVWDAVGVAPYEIDGAPDSRPYQRASSLEKGERVFTRQVTFAETRATRVRNFGDSAFKGHAGKSATAISAIIRFQQDLAHTIQVHETTEYLVATQEDDSVAEKDRWILDDWPDASDTDAPISLSRKINLNDENERASGSLRARARVPGTWVKIQDNEDSKRVFGALAGKVVAGPAYVAMAESTDNKPLVDIKALRAAMLVWKKNKTVFAPVAHVNNVLGNVTMAYYYDIPTANIAVAAKLVYSRMAEDRGWKGHKLTPEQQRMASEMDAAGLTLGSRAAADFDIEMESELKKAGQKMSAFIDQKVGGARDLTKVFLALESVSSFSSDAYSNQDNIFRLAVYMTHLQDSGGIGHKGEVDTTIRQQAAQKAKQAFVDYRIHAPVIRAGRETLFPFVAWPYRMVPMLFKTMITKPWKAANTIGAIYGLNALFYAMLGKDGDDEEYERNLMPEWHRNGIAWLPNTPTSIRLPFGSEDNAYFLNLSRTIPLADIDAVTGSGTPGVISPGGPAAILMSILSNHDPFTNKEITNGTEDFLEARSKQAAWLLRAAAPGAISNAFSEDAKAARVGPLGAEYNFWVGGAKMLGVSSFQVNVPEAAFYKDNGRKAIERKFKREISRRQRYELRQKDPDYEDLYNDLEGLQNRMMDEIAEFMGEPDA